MTNQKAVLKTQTTYCTSRYQQISTMRVLACFAIVLLHTVLAANEYYVESISASENLISRIIENNLMWPVPLFLMVTGALQLNSHKKLTYKKLYCKYIFRIVVALFFCCAVFRFFDIVMDGETLSLSSICKCFFEFITASSWGHLWYLYLLIGIYVLLPFFRMIANRASDIELLYLVCVYLIFDSILPILGELGVHIGFYISESIIYPAYLFIGHMLFEQRVKISNKVAAFSLLFSIIVIVLLDFAKYTYGIKLPSGLFGYASPIVIIQTICIFALFNNNNKNRDDGLFATLINLLDECSFGIYLVHMMFVRLIFRYWAVNPYNSLAVFTLGSITLVVFLISFIIIYGLRKIPGVDLFL